MIVGLILSLLLLAAAAAALALLATLTTHRAEKQRDDLWDRVRDVIRDRDDDTARLVLKALRGPR